MEKMFSLYQSLGVLSDPPPVQVDPKAAAGKQQRGGKTTPKGPRGFSQGENEVRSFYIIPYFIFYSCEAVS